MSSVSKTKDFKLERFRPQDLIPYELNSKKHPPEQIARLVATMRKHGFDVPIVVDKDNVIIKGHGRRLAAIELGMEFVPVIVRADLSPKEVAEARLADNRAALSDIDGDLLKQELTRGDFKLDLDGIFDAKELEFMPSDLGAMNAGVFETDMGAVMAGQRADVANKLEAAKGARVPLARAFGFKDMPVESVQLITQLMARAEAVSGKQGAEALAEFAALHV